jgi:hypothetical protein
VGAALAPGGPDALVPFKLALASADSVGNDVYVAVVIDFGSGSGLSSITKCVPVLSSDHDTDALAAAVGEDNVAYGASGLLCAIDNYPANGVQDCGASIGGGKYDYWSYWHGTSGAWQYAENGPSGQSVSAPSDDVEGWVFQNDQPDNSSDPSPTESPSYAQICNASTEVPPAGITSPSTTTTTTGTAGGGTPQTTVASGKSPGQSSATTTTTTKSKTPSGSSAATSTTSTTVRAEGGTTTSTISTTSDHRGARPPATHTALAATRTASHGSGGNPALPIALIVAVIALLGGAALFRWIRRPVEE